MAKKTKISNGELTAIFHERITGSPDWPQQGISIAIVPSEPHGWTVLMSARQQKQHPDCSKRIEAIQKQLRAIYVLARD